MEKSTFNIQHHISETLRNGFRQDLKTHPEMLGFIVGSIDNGFSLKKTGPLVATYRRLQIFLVMSADDLVVKAFKGKDKLFELPYGMVKDGFRFNDVSIHKGGNVYHKQIFICNATK